MKKFAFASLLLASISAPALAGGPVECTAGADSSAPRGRFTLARAMASTDRGATEKAKESCLAANGGVKAACSIVRCEAY